MSSKHTNADAATSSLVEKVARAIFADIGLPDAPWVDEWKARAPKAAIAVVLRELLNAGITYDFRQYARENGIEL